MKKATWNGAIIAQSENTVIVEGNDYFPPESLNKEFFKETEHLSTCPWKGLANYYTIEVDGKQNENAAWYYKKPKEKATQIKDHVAFWKGVVVE